MTSNATDSVKENEIHKAPVETKTAIPREIVWRNMILAVVFHTGAVYGGYLAFTSASWKTLLFTLFIDVIAGFGVTAGMHRLWAHRSYKAKLPLRIMLAILGCLADEGSIFAWCRTHRVHHKHSETDADPHNAKRGFFFSHIGWILVKKHPEVTRKGREIDLSDLLVDPVVTFQRKYYIWLVLVISFIIPTVTPTLLWGENLTTSFFVAVVLRYIMVYHQTFCINSVAHLWGNRPYDKNIYPRDSTWAIATTFGEGFHNYHHTFPWDYAASEYGMRYNIQTAFINLMAWMGLAYDLKTVSPEIIYQKKMRTGEGRSRQMLDEHTCVSKNKVTPENK